MENENKNFTLDSFTRAEDKKIATNASAYEGHNWWRQRVTKVRDYTLEEVHHIIGSGSLEEQRRLSFNYFNKSGYYKRIILYYATLLKYSGLLIPNPRSGKDLSSSAIQKRYYNALDYVERLTLSEFFTECARRALIDGCYFGVISHSTKDGFAVIDLPAEFCQTRYKDIYGNDLLEFNLQYFDRLTNSNGKQIALDAFPKQISKAYAAYSKGKRASNWYLVPADVGICFPFFDGRPLFLNVIPAVIDYEDATATEHDRAEDAVHKIIVQQIPHLADGRLLFEPDEAAEIHAGTVGMLKGNKNVSVLTTYGDASAISSNGATEGIDDTLTRSEQNIFAQAGTSSQLFASTGTSSLKKSLENDLSLMMYFANKLSNFITNLVNGFYSNGSVYFKYLILPVSHYNAEDYAKLAKDLASSGYSFLLPSAAMGISQRDLVSIKNLENNVLKMSEILIPLSNSYTQSSTQIEESDNEGGRPELEPEDKSEQTQANEKSIDNQAGGNG